MFTAGAPLSASPLRGFRNRLPHSSQCLGPSAQVIGEEGILDAAAAAERCCMGKDEDEDAGCAFLLTCVLHTACAGRAASAQSETEDRRKDRFSHAAVDVGDAR
ncbi:hypothetical protein AOLI_G00246830 [Acnodon oligacanthus]